MAGANPRATDPALNADVKALSAMQGLISGNNRALSSMADSLDRIQQTLKETNKDYKDTGVSLRSLLKDTADLEFATIRIEKLRKKSVGVGATQQGTKQYIQSLQKEYRVLLDVLNTGKGAGKHVKEIKAALSELDNALKTVKKTGKGAWNETSIQSVNAALATTASRVGKVQEAMVRVKTKNMADGFKGIHKAIDTAFDNQFMTKLSRIKGVSTIMKGFTIRAQAREAQVKIKEHMAARREHNEGVHHARAQEVFQKYGKAGVARLRELGYHGAIEGQRPAGGRLRNAKGHFISDEPVPGAPTPTIIPKGKGGKKGAAGRGPTPGAPEPEETTAPGGKKGRGKKVAAPAPPPAPLGPVSLEEVQAIMGGEQGMIGRKLTKMAAKGAGPEGGWVSKRMANLAAKGGGMVGEGVKEAAMGGAAGGISSILGTIGKVAPGMGVVVAGVSALIEMRDKVALENRKLLEGTAAIGGMGNTGNHTGYFGGIRNTLTSTSFHDQTLYGQGLEQNMKLMQNLGETGWATGGTLQKGPDARTGVNLGEALNGGYKGEGGGFYGTVMKNAVFNGKNLGMDQGTSAKLTIKLMEKFGQTTVATQDFFVHLDTMMHSTGITASKYLDVIDGITGEFNDLNKSLEQTVSTINVLGKSGQFTGDQIKDMVNNIQKPTQTTTAQSIVLAQGMSKGTKDDMATSIEFAAKQVLDPVAQKLRNTGVLKEGEGLIDANGKLTNLDRARTGIMQNPNATTEDKRADILALEAAANKATIQLSQADALRSGSAASIAGVGNLLGQNSTIGMGMREQSFRRVMTTSGISQGMQGDVLSGDQNALREMLKKNPLVMGELIKQGTFSSGEDLAKYMTSRGAATNAGAQTAIGWSAEMAGRGATGSEKTPEDKAKTETLATLMRAMNPEAAKGKSNKELAWDFRKKAEADPSGMAAELKKLPETFRQVMTDGTKMQIASQEKIEKEESARRAKDLMTQTKPTSEIYASAFEYLFNKVVAALDKLLDWFTFKSPDKTEFEEQEGKKQEETGARNQGMEEAVNALGTAEMSPEDMKLKKEIQARIGTYGNNWGMMGKDEGALQTLGKKYHIAISRGNGTDQHNALQVSDVPGAEGNTKPATGTPTTGGATDRGGAAAAIPNLDAQIAEELKSDPRLSAYLALHPDQTSPQAQHLRETATAALNAPHAEGTVGRFERNSAGTIVYNFYENAAASAGRKGKSEKVAKAVQKAEVVPHPQEVK